MASEVPLPRAYLEAPAAEPEARGLRQAGWYLQGAALTPLYWLLARCRGAPGLAFHCRCARLGLRLLRRGGAGLPLGWAYHLIFRPMDSTRYFELDFAWRSLADLVTGRYLDISSPRLLPILLVEDRPGLSADLLNPDVHDLQITRDLVAAAGVVGRCRLHGATIAEAAFAAGVFDAITSLSVMEHIPEDRQAVEIMWALLKPGGRLVLTLPAAARAWEQYINTNEYDLLTPDERGFVFWQRFYDRRLLEECIFSVTGLPVREAVYGERIAGAFAANAALKRRTYGSRYPFWREPYMMAQEYSFFPAVDDLPGEGVIALEFRKP
jgi:SAM-dependent methyltransferase